MTDPAGGPHSISALMVEDDDDLRLALEASLSMFGIKVHGVSRAAEFRARIAAQEFDLAIVDLGLPDGDGLAIVRALTDDPTGPGVIILTAASDTEDRIKGFSAGADLYFTKPVDVRELAVAAIRLVQRLRRGAAPEQAAPAEKITGRWTVSRSRWALEGPTGVSMSLTPKEMTFVEALAAAPNSTVARDHVLQLLGYADDPSGNRALDALVRRLRIKSEETLARALPLRTVHGIGYIFSDPVTVS